MNKGAKYLEQAKKIKIKYLGYAQFYLKLYLSNDQTATAKYSCDFTDGTGMAFVAQSVLKSAKKFYENEYSIKIISSEFITKDEYEDIKGDMVCNIGSDKNDTVMVHFRTKIR